MRESEPQHVFTPDHEYSIEEKLSDILTHTMSKKRISDSHTADFDTEPSTEELRWKEQLAQAASAIEAEVTALQEETEKGEQKLQDDVFQSKKQEEYRESSPSSPPLVIVARSSRTSPAQQLKLLHSTEVVQEESVGKIDQATAIAEKSLPPPSPPQKETHVVVVREPAKVSLERVTTFLTTSSERIQQARIVAMILVFLAAVLLLSYSVYFFYVFETFNNTTSYFPWAWHIGYSTLPPVLELAAIGMVLSVFSAGISIGATSFFLGALRTTSTSSSFFNAQVPVVNGEPIRPTMNIPNLLQQVVGSIPKRIERVVGPRKILSIIFLFCVGALLLILGATFGVYSGVFVYTQGVHRSSLALVWGLIVLGLSCVTASFSWTIFGKMD